jgi:hypothetical protein
MEKKSSPVHSKLDRPYYIGGHEIPKHLMGPLLLMSIGILCVLAAIVFQVSIMIMKKKHSTGHPRTANTKGGAEQLTPRLSDTSDSFNSGRSSGSPFPSPLLQFTNQTYPIYGSSSPVMFHG